MTKQKADADTHQKAHDLAEAGIDKAVEGDTSAGKRMVNEANRLDPSAVEEVLEEIEEERAQAEKFERQQTPPQGADGS